MSLSSYPRQVGRRSGQALLLAVLVMVFVAIIGVTFITVVAINIGQTGREEERDKARQAAQAGLAFVNAQLTNGLDGLKWRPEREVQSDTPTPVRLGPPPNNNPFYWTAFEQAQGWADYNGSCDTAAGPCEGNFVKFPDPRSTNPSFNAPNYLTKVEKVVAGDADNQNNDKTGALRITTIGLSPDDPTSFYKIVAYKAGPAQQPLTSAMRSVSNWDFVNETVPVAEMPASPTSGTTATLQNVQGNFPAENFYVLIGNPTGTLQPTFVSSYNSATKVMTFANSVNWPAGARVEIAAAFGAPVAVDYNRNTVYDAVAEKVVFDVSQATTPGSIQVNGSTIIEGNLLSRNLQEPSTTTGLAGRLQSSGLIQVSSTTARALGTVGTTNIDGVLKSSTDTQFPLDGVGSLQEKLSLVRDGADRITNNPAASERKVQPFTPPNMTAGGDGFGRYRQLTKYSPSLTSNSQGAAYGYGEGIYINNPQDREKVNTGTGGYREMTQKELTALWFDTTSTTASYLRSGTPDDPDNTTNVRSLEEQHLRGWIAPDEFLPRGAMVEINDNATLTITLDPRDDGSNSITTNLRNNDGPVPAKSWKADDGTLRDGVYRRTNIAWPANGVLFAEGNIRIRGKATTNPPRSLTVVSMNNIYIEDSLDAGDKKILLLARRNVVVNPTRVLGRPEAQTRFISRSGTTITVADASLFNVGDRIQVGTGATRRWVTGVDTTANTITHDGTAVPAAPTDPVVTLQTDSDNDTITPDRPFYGDSTPHLQAESQVMQRRFWNGNNSEVRIALRHGAEKRVAYSVEVGGTPPSTVDVSNGINATAPATSPRIVTPADKRFISNPASEPQQSFPVTPNTATLTNLIDDLNNDPTHALRPPDPGATWWYIANATTTKGDYQPLNFWYLAGIGLRFEVNPLLAPVPPAFPFRESILTKKEFPVATSVQLNIANPVDGNQLATVRLENGAGGYDTVKQFGFSPIFDDGDPATIDDVVDALTFDRSFYTTLSGGANAGFQYLTTDSRTIANNVRPNAFNTLVWNFHPDVLAAFSDTSPVRPIPRYGFKRIKLENLAQYTSSASQFQDLEPGYTFDINAYVYAQEGSWLVIPSVPFDENIKTDPATGDGYVDLPGGTANFKDPGENLDLNRDGVFSREEQVAVYRFARYNYKINFNGAIMENRTATILDPDGTGPLRGQVADWTDSWATVKITQNKDLNGDGTVENNWAGDAATDSFQNNLSTDAGNFSTITYNYDPEAANGLFDNDDGFHPPVTPELIYQTG